MGGQVRLFEGDPSTGEKGTLLHHSAKSLEAGGRGVGVPAVGQTLNQVLCLLTH